VNGFYLASSCHGSCDLVLSPNCRLNAPKCNVCYLAKLFPASPSWQKLVSSSGFVPKQYKRRREWLGLNFCNYLIYQIAEAVHAEEWRRPYRALGLSVILFKSCKAERASSLFSDGAYLSLTQSSGMSIQKLNINDVWKVKAGA